jgi:hypothetical protein
METLFDMPAICPDCKGTGKTWNDKVGAMIACRNSQYHLPQPRDDDHATFFEGTLMDGLENKPSVPRARTTDPGTSHAAAKSVVLITEKQQAVLRVFDVYGSMTDTELLERYRDQVGLPQQSDSGIRTRRHELTERGHLAAVGETTLPSGRRAIIWDRPLG